MTSTPHHPFPIKITFKVHLYGVATGNFVSLFPMVPILWPTIWCTLLPMVSKLPWDTESAARDNNPRKRKAFTVHRIQCATEWKSKLTTRLKYLQLSLCSEYDYIHVASRICGFKQFGNWVTGLLQRHAIYLKETVFVISNEIYRAWYYLTEQVVIKTQEY